MTINTNKILPWLDAVMFGIFPEALITNIDGFQFPKKKRKCVKKSTSSWKGGSRPFLGALIEYVKVMKDKIETGINKLNDRKSYTYIDLDILINEEITIKLDNDKEKTYKFHTVHYGPQMKESRYNVFKRDKVWTKLGFKVHPFKLLQREYLKRGYYLVDESDHRKKTNKLFIKIYNKKPIYRDLWHGYCKMT